MASLGRCPSWHLEAGRCQLLTCPGHRPVGLEGPFKVRDILDGSVAFENGTLWFKPDPLPRPTSERPASSNTDDLTPSTEAQEAGGDDATF